MNKSEINSRIEEEYQKVMSNALYWNDRLKKSERITKFNFEEVAENKTFLDHHFESIHQKIWHKFKLELTMEESIVLNEHVLDKLYELLEKDVQELRRNQLIKSLSTVWEVLQMAREDCISEGIESNDEQWNDVTYAMAKIHEALNIKHEEV